MYIGRLHYGQIDCTEPHTHTHAEATRTDHHTTEALGGRWLAGTDKKNLLFHPEFREVFDALRKKYVLLAANFVNTGYLG
jgi:hypothetical protein